MSELSSKLAALKGKRTTKEIIGLAEISRETFRKVERGEAGVKLSTLKAIADALGVSQDQWTDLVAAWLKVEAGEEAHRLSIKPKHPSDVGQTESSQVAHAAILFQQLNAAERQEILKAMERKEVRNCLPSINRVWERLSKPSPSSSEDDKRVLRTVRRDIHPDRRACAPTDP